MQLIQICPSYKPAYRYGGPTISISMLCEQLQTSRLKPVVLTTTGNGNMELDVPCNAICIVDGVSVRYFMRITKDHSHFSPNLCLHFYRLIKNTNRSADDLLIHIHSWWNLVSILSCLIARCFNLTIVISPRGMLTDFSFKHGNGLAKRCIHGLFGKWLLNGCHLHATSDKEKEDILSFLKPKSIVVIPNFVRLPTGNILRPPTSSLKPFKLLFFSRIDEKKGIELLFTALAKLEVEYELTIAGTGASRYIERLKIMSTTLGIAQNITWLGHINNEDKYAELSKHELLVLPSFNENFGNVVVESLSVGTAVLISNQVGLSEYIQISKLGWVSKLDSTELAAHISRIAGSKTALTAIRTDGPKRIAADFDSHKLLVQYLNFYNGLKAFARN
jgi:glycosyltransferase involved in cell wall biosynthesis